MATSHVTSKVEIANLALAQVGENRMTSFEDDTEYHARVIRDNYNAVRDSLLDEHNWTFAIKRVELTESATDVPFGDKQSFPLPSDFIRAVDVNDNQSGGRLDTFAIEIEGNYRVIVTSSDAINLKYVYRNDTPALYTPSFVKAISLTLAGAVAFAIAGNGPLASGLQAAGMEALMRAKMIDVNSQKRTAKPPWLDSPLVDARKSSALG